MLPGVVRVEANGRHLEILTARPEDLLRDAAGAGCRPARPARDEALDSRTPSSRWSTPVSGRRRRDAGNERRRAPPRVRPRRLHLRAGGASPVPGHGADARVHHSGPGLPAHVLRLLRRDDERLAGGPDLPARHLRRLRAHGALPVRVRRRPRDRARQRRAAAEADHADAGGRLSAGPGGNGAALRHGHRPRPVPARGLRRGRRGCTAGSGSRWPGSCSRA